MPGRNGMGPTGNGPMTGRGLGNCTGVNAGFSPRSGRGFGMGYGMGRRNRCFNYGQPYYNARPLTAQEQKEILEQQKAALQAELDNINSTLNDL